MAGSKEFRDKIEERKGTEWYDKALKVGDLHDARIDDNGGKQMYSGAEIRAEMRHGRGDMTTEELTKQYEDLYAQGKINLNGNAKEFLTQHHGASLVRNNNGEPPTSEVPPEAGTPPVTVPENPAPTPTPEPEPTPTPEPQLPPPSSNYQIQRNQIINSGNNSIVNNGDNNTTNIGQDFSNTQAGSYVERFAEALKDKYVLNLANR